MSGKIQLELIGAETVAARFPYDAALVAEIKRLNNRRWNPRKSQWEVHISELAGLMKLLGLRPQEVPAGVIEAYRRKWIRCKLRVHLGPLECRLAGTGAPLREIDEATSFFVAGHRFSDKFKSGQWDGKRHLFGWKTQKLPAGLWPRVRGILEEQGVEYELEEEEKAGGCRPEAGGTYSLRPTASSLDVEADEGVRAPRELRDYQQVALEAALREGRGIIQMATGGGKTLLAAHLLARLGRPAFFFVHTRDLLYQAAEVFGRELGIEVGLLGDGQASLRKLTVATIQTALQTLGETSPERGARKKARGAEDEEEEASAERITDFDEATRQQAREAIERAEVVIFDECHHVPADGFYKIAMRTGSAWWRFGLSATPWRDDGADLLLEAALGPKIAAVSSSDLIERGYLVAPQIRMVRTGRGEGRGARGEAGKMQSAEGGVRNEGRGEGRGARGEAGKMQSAEGGVRNEGRGEGRGARGESGKTKGMRYQDIYQGAIVENRERNRAIAAQARAWAAEGLSVLILVAQVTHGRALAELLPEANFVYGALESELRRRYLRELEQKLRPLMIATTLADEGLDIPSLGAVILGGGGKSPTKAFQRIGRALRPAPGKTEARVLDFLDAAPYLKEHSAARLALYRQEPSFIVAGCQLPVAS